MVSGTVNIILSRPVGRINPLRINILLLPHKEHRPLDLFSGSIYEPAKHSQMGVFVTFDGPKVNKVVLMEMSFWLDPKERKDQDAEILARLPCIR